MKKARGRSNPKSLSPKARGNAHPKKPTERTAAGHNRVKQASGKLEIHEAIYDELTGLYNPVYFDCRIEEEIARAKRNKHSLAILLCELDHFKPTNHTSGHWAGDELLKSVAISIKKSTRGTDLIFRWGEEDKILVLLSDTSPDGILITTERIRRGISKVGEQAHLDLNVTIGAALYPEQAGDADGLIRIADQALSIARKGRDKIHIGADDYHLDEYSIKVVFQPVVDIRVNELVGYEALSRDPQGKLGILELFKMNKFTGYEALSRDPQGKLGILEIFKRYRAIGQLNEIKRICFNLQLKRAQEKRLERVFINIDFNLLNYLESVPKPSGMEVILEISELEALQDIERHLEISKRWRALGYKFAIDDFGAGYISLPFISQLVPDYIKLDRSTLLQAVSCEKFKGFLKDLVLTLQNYVTAGIIAEGVETDKELEVAKEIGVSHVQGFLLGRPEELK